MHAADVFWEYAQSSKLYQNEGKLVDNLKMDLLYSFTAQPSDGAIGDLVLDEIAASELQLEYNAWLDEQLTTWGAAA